MYLLIIPLTPREECATTSMFHRKSFCRQGCIVSRHPKDSGITARVAMIYKRQFGPLINTCANEKMTLFHNTHLILTNMLYKLHAIHVTAPKSGKLKMWHNITHWYSEKYFFASRRRPNDGSGSLGKKSTISRARVVQSLKGALNITYNSFIHVHCPHKKKQLLSVPFHFLRAAKK